MSILPNTSNRSSGLSEPSKTIYLTAIVYLRENDMKEKWQIVSLEIFAYGVGETFEDAKDKFIQCLNKVLDDNALAKAPDDYWDRWYMAISNEDWKTLIINRDGIRSLSSEVVVVCYQYIIPNVNKMEE